MKFKKKENQEQDFELNLASIIDCFTVLITYLLVSVSFIKLGMIDVSATSSAATKDSSNSDIAVIVHILSNLSIDVQTLGLEKKSISIHPNSEHPDFQAMAEYLRQLKIKYPALKSAMLNATDSVPYLIIVKAIENLKPIVPELALSSDTL